MRVKTTTILLSLLAISVLVNVTLVGFIIPSQQAAISMLVKSTNAANAENIRLQKLVSDENRTLQDYASQLSFYRVKPVAGGLRNQTQASYITGYASLEAPAVSEQVVEENDNGFITQSVVENGTMMNISVEIRPGEGRVLVQTTPLMGIVFQDAANTAVAVAGNRTGADLAGSDVIFSIEADRQIPAVDGPSAGALMSLITIAALRNEPINASITLTGTIDKDGHIGAIGGVIEKATAAKNAGRTRFFLPAENAELTGYTVKTTDIGGFQLVRQVPEQVDTKDYIEKNIGIPVTFVRSIDDLLPQALT